MKRRQNSDKGESSGKKTKTKNEGGRNQNGVVTRAAAKKQQLSPAIFKLNMDCFEEIFEYLSLKDVVAFGSSCKRLCHYVGYWLRQNYPLLRFYFQENNDIRMYGMEFQGNIMKDFCPFIQNIFFFSHDLILQRYRYFSTNCSTSLNEIIFYDIDVFPTEVEYFKEVLRNVEIVRIETNAIYDDAYKPLLRSCENMKYLSVIQRQMRHGSIIIKSSLEKNNNWLLQKYPKLEKFHFQVRNTKSFSCLKNVKELTSFFKLNSTIREFSTEGFFLWENYNHLLKSKIQLDVLSLRFESSWSLPSVGNLDYDRLDKYYCRRLHKLYENGNYIRFHLRHNRIKPNEIKLLASLKGLVKLIIEEHELDEEVNLAALTYLEDLRCSDFNNIKRWKQLPYDLVNLRRLAIIGASSDDIFPFISSAVKLKEVRIIILEGGTHFNENTNVLDLVTLNNERRKLKAAQKIIFYLSEKIYLATKWTFNKTNFNLIQLKCFEACKWDRCKIMNE